MKTSSKSLLIHNVPTLIAEEDRLLSLPSILAKYEDVDTTARRADRELVSR